jgi:hypothetical protein
MEKVKVSDPMRLFTVVVSGLYAAGGVWMSASDESFGRFVAWFFGRAGEQQVSHEHLLLLLTL